MLDFSSAINLPLVFGAIIALAILMYVLLDGFDLGVGILFPFAPSNDCRSRMMNSIAPFWDGNETWLVLGGGGLFAAFPLAYSILMPAFYLPIVLMLLGLIFRGVAFEFRFKTETAKERKIWDWSFFFGSIIAAFFQGVILGTFLQGVKVVDKSFAGNGLEWLNSFSLMCGVALVFGYALLGSTWLVMKTSDLTQKWAREISFLLLSFVALFMILVSIKTPFIHHEIFLRWFSLPNLIYFSPIPILTLAAFILLIITLHKKKEYWPFFITISLFLLAFFGLVISLFPYGVPFALKFEDLAAANTSLSLLLVGVVLILPVILCYTAYSYYVFRGKSSHEKMY